MRTRTESQQAMLFPVVWGYDVGMGTCKYDKEAVRLALSKAITKNRVSYATVAEGTQIKEGTLRGFVSAGHLGPDKQAALEAYMEQNNLFQSTGAPTLIERLNDMERAIRGTLHKELAELADLCVDPQFSTVGKLDLILSSLNGCEAKVVKWRETIQHLLERERETINSE